MTADDLTSFTTFVVENRAPLGRAAVLLAGNRSAGEDLLQEALVRTWQRWNRVESGREMAFCRRVMANLAIDWFRRRRFTSDAPPPERATDDPYRRVDDRDQVVRALARLTPRERAMVVLRYWADLSVVEVADELGVSVGTVKSTCSRALARLSEEKVR